MTAEIVGPTIPDLTERLCVNYEEISRALVGKSIGVGIGSIVGGFCNEIFYNHVDLFMSLSLYLMAIACACLPLVDELWFVFAMLVLNGFGDGIINTGGFNLYIYFNRSTGYSNFNIGIMVTNIEYSDDFVYFPGGNTMEMHLWGESVAPHMHALHFGFGLGALIAPQIARPFLSPIPDDDNHTACDEDYYVNGTSLASESRIEIAYGIIGIVVFLFACVIMAFYIRGPPEGYPKRVPNKSLKTLLSASSCSRGYTIFAIQLLILLFFFFMQAIGGERAFGKFLFSFAIEADVKFTKDEASYLQTAFWASFTFGRLAGALVAKFVSINLMIIGNIIGALITSIVMSIWAPTVPEVLWVFTCFMGIFLAVAFPNGMSWSNIHLDMNSMAVMLLVFGGAVGGFIYQSVTGSLFENEGPETLMYVMVGYALALAVVYSIMQTIAVCHTKLVLGPAEEAGIDIAEVIPVGGEESNGKMVVADDTDDSFYY